MATFVSLCRATWRVGLAAVVIAVMALGRPAAADDGEGLIPEGDWTDEQVAYMLDLIARTEKALPERFPVTATYDELSAALGPLGFFEFGATAPGGYDHWINPAWLFDDHLIDPEWPESLVYQRLPDGRWQLVSAMFMLSPDIGMDEIPEDIAWLPGWHGHPELCVGQDGKFAGLTDPENPNCPPGTHQATTPLMMHVWIVDNACHHRFGGVGVNGLHCDVSMNHDGGHDEGDTGNDGGGHDEGDTGNDGGGPTTPTGVPSAPPAQAVVAAPTFTG